MSDMYAIKTSTLTALGDAVRSKAGETREEIIDIEYLEWNWDFLRGGKELLTLNEYNKYIYETTIEIPNAYRYKLVYSYEHTQEYAGSQIYFYYISGTTGASTTIAMCKYGKTETDVENEFYVLNPTIEIRVSMEASHYSLHTINKEFWIAVKVYAYDRDGNLITTMPIAVKNTMTPLEMANEISGLATIPNEGFNITGDCQYKFSSGGWDWFINLYGDKINTQEINNANYMFSHSQITSLPFDINFKDGGCSINNMFNYCTQLTSIPSIDFKQTSYKSSTNIFTQCNNLTDFGTIKNLYPESLNSIFNGCFKLRYLPQFENLNLDRIHTYSYGNIGNMFNNCYSLRLIPEDFLKQIWVISTSASYMIFYSGFNNCYALDEIRGLNPKTGTLTSNVFSSTFAGCFRLKEIIFAAQDDGTPYSVKWNKQTIDLSSYVGVVNSLYLNKLIKNYNSGITADKEVTDDASYQALKNDPDWYTLDYNYSRYNHDGAVNTINSLPIITTSGATNTIKFLGASGSATDGGAINTLTEEEIAVAAAKGWTVTFV